MIEVKISIKLHLDRSQNGIQQKPDYHLLLQATRVNNINFQMTGNESILLI